MKLKLLAGVGLLVAFTASGALAQGAVQKGANAVGNAVGNAGKAVGDAITPGPGPWTTNNVTAARPFGTIDVSAAGNSPESVRVWSAARTPSERSELSGRCGVINAPANASIYPANAHDFCRNFLTASAAPAPGKAIK